jgi:hypothetical protein
LRAFWHILTSLVIVTSANIGSFRPEHWHSLTLPKVRIGGNFQASTHDELAQPKPEHEPSQRSSGRNDTAGDRRKKHARFVPIFQLIPPSIG